MHPGICLVHVYDVAISGDDDDPIHRLLENGPEALFALQQQLFRVLPLGDIFLDSDKAADDPMLVLDWGNGCLFPEEFTALPFILKFATPSLAGEQCVPQCLVNFRGSGTPFEEFWTLTNGLCKGVACNR